LLQIREGLCAQPPRPYNSEWQRAIAAAGGMDPKSLLDSFIDPNGDLLVESLIALCDVSIETHLPILLQ
jgi:hypothetical protein